MDIREIILAVLLEAKTNGFSPLLKTTLVKFIYLVDFYTAEESEGKPVSNIEWKFLHFGPFAPEISQAINELRQNQSIYLVNKDSEEDGFYLYELGRKSGAKSLDSLGITRSIQLRFQADLKRYAKDLSRLLDFVYFRTTPMLEAKPGDVLDFSNCKKLRIDDVRHLEMNKLRPKAIKQTREKLRELIASQKNKKIIENGPFDEVYYSAINLLEEEPLHAGLKSKAKLNL